MTALLEVDAISRRFGGLNALKDVSFAINTGEIVGLIGPNGAGKTTCFNVVSGVMPPSAGAIRFGGRSIVGKKPSEIVGEGLVRTFQATTIFPEATVIENVMRGAFSTTPVSMLGSVFNTSATRATMAATTTRCEQLLERLSLAQMESNASPNQARMEPVKRRITTLNDQIAQARSASDPSTRQARLAELAAQIRLTMGKLELAKTEATQHVVESMVSRALFVAEGPGFQPVEPTVQSIMNTIFSYPAPDAERSESIATRCLALIERTFGADDPKVVSVLDRLALLYSGRGQPERRHDRIARKFDPQRRSCE